LIASRIPRWLSQLAHCDSPFPRFRVSAFPRFSQVVLGWKSHARAAMMAWDALTFRRGTVADARAAADLWLRARTAALGAIPQTVHRDDDVRAWFASHVVCETELWIAQDPVGELFGILVLDGPWLDQLYVEPTMTGRGIGSALLNVAKRERHDGLRLWTFASNTGAQRFYERHGFVATRRTDGDNEEGAPDILYVWHGDGIAP
jgi:GNAT superfamily N-acetyltransferase